MIKKRIFKIFLALLSIPVIYIVYAVVVINLATVSNYTCTGAFKNRTDGLISDNEKLFLRITESSILAFPFTLINEEYNLTTLYFDAPNIGISDHLYSRSFLESERSSFMTARILHKSLGGYAIAEYNAVSKYLTINDNTFKNVSAHSKQSRAA